MFFKDFSRQIVFSRTFQGSPVYSSTFQACANPAASEDTVPVSLSLDGAFIFSLTDRCMA